VTGPRGAQVSWRRTVLLATLSTAVLGVYVLVLAQAASATVVRHPIRMSFTNLVPGESRTQSRTISLPQDARVSHVEASSTTGTDAFTWRVQLCPRSGGCLTVGPEATDARLAGGTYDLRTTVTMAQDAEVARTGALSGVLTFTADGDDGLSDPKNLASTGIAVRGAAALAVLLLLLGMVLVLMGRRRADQDEEDAP